MCVRAYVCPKSPPIFRGWGGVWACGRGTGGFQWGAIPLSGNPNIYKKSLTVEPDELPFPKRPAENKFKQPKNKKLDFIFFPAHCTFWLEGGGVLVLVLIWVVILELVLMIWQFIRKKEAINCTKVQRFTANTTATAATATAATATAATATAAATATTATAVTTTATALSQVWPPSIRRTWDPKTSRMDVVMYN